MKRSFNKKKKEADQAGVSVAMKTNVKNNVPRGQEIKIINPVNVQDVGATRMTCVAYGCLS